MGLPEVEVPVASGRELAQLNEAASLAQKSKAMGHDSVAEFNR
jgi:serine kinase of HPr protein (carbohydrate metabolism regulator)